jgi:hypothetical protein
MEALAAAITEEEKRREHAAEQERKEREEAEARAARRKRDEIRARKQRRAFAAQTPLGLAEARKKKARGHCEEGKRLVQEGSHGAAANLFRLARELDPSVPEYHELWQRAHATARRERANRAFAAARRAIDLDEHANAARLLMEAVEANPTPLHLSHAAEALREQDPNKARELALRCLDALNAEVAMGQASGSDELGGIHVRLGRVFASLGQKKAAERQAALAREHIPDDPRLVALLNSIKVT